MVVPSKIGLRKFEAWRLYLESEKTGARQALSSWLGGLLAVFGLLVATSITLAKDNRFDLVPLTTAVFVWSISLLAIATYAWYQYLGTLKSISRGYLAPESQTFYSESDTPRSDFISVYQRDAGNIFQMMFGRLAHISPSLREDRKARASVRLAVVTFWATMGLSVTAIVILISYASSGSPESIWPWTIKTFAAATVSAILCLAALRNYVTHAEG